MARPHKVARHVHPDVKAPTKKPPARATGIDYLRLLEAQQQAQLGTAINFAALTGPTEPTATTTGDTDNTTGGDDQQP
jgi:hypothetical protein